MKSTKATDEFPPCMQVIFDGLNAPTTTPRLKTLAVQFMSHVCKKWVYWNYIAISFVE